MRVVDLPPLRFRPDRGHALAAVYITMIPIVGLISAFFLRSHTEISMHELRKHEVRATQRALAALEVGRNVIMNSSYTSSNNDALKNAFLDNTPAGLRPSWFGQGYVGIDVTTGDYTSFTDPLSLGANERAFHLLTSIDLEDDQVGESDDNQDKVAIFAANLTGLWHLIEARSTMGTVSRTARVLVRERDPFTRFSIFIDNHFQGISGAPKGDIHSNRTLQIFYPGSVFDDYVSARDSFQWMIGASAGNTTFNSGYATPTAEINMPPLSSIQAIRPHATGPYYVSSSYNNTEITFSGTNVLIKARLISTGAVQTLHNGPLPGNGVIYSEGNIKILQGDLDGRVTVACGSASGIKITGSLRYVDGDGDPAMLNPATPANYIANPNYDGSSALGIVSLGSVTYSSSIPTNFEQHAAVFSSAGHVGLPGLNFTSNGAYVTSYDGSFQKQNLCVLGSTIADRRWVGSVVNSSGTVLSGFQNGSLQYDRSLLDNPPPFFLEINRPLFKAVEVVENVVDA